MYESHFRFVCCFSFYQGVGGEETYEARFYVPAGGSVWIRNWEWEIEGQSMSLPNGTTSSTNLKGTQVTIYVDIYNTLNDSPQSSTHDWLIYITDILDAGGNH